MHNPSFPLAGSSVNGSTLNKTCLLRWKVPTIIPSLPTAPAPNLFPLWLKSEPLPAHQMGQRRRGEEEGGYTFGRCEELRDDLHAEALAELLPDLRDEKR